MTVNLTTGLWGVEDMSQAAAGGTLSRTRNVSGTDTTVTPAKFNASNFPILATATATQVSNAGGAATYPGPAIGEILGRMRASVADIAALRAITTAAATDRQACYVDAKQALYFFDSAATAADDGNLVIRPDDYATAGNWVKQSAGAADSATTATTATTANALATTGASVDVSAAAPPVAGQFLRATDATTAAWQSFTATLTNCATIAALKAIADMADNDQAVVEAYGLYRYDAASTAIADDVFVVTPDGGTGRWICEALGAFLVTELVGI